MVPKLFKNYCTVDHLRKNSVHIRLLSIHLFKFKNYYYYDGIVFFTIQYLVNIITVPILKTIKIQVFNIRFERINTYFLINFTTHQNFCAQ